MQHEQMQHTAIRLPPVLIADIDRIAAIDGVPRSEWIRSALRQAVDDRGRILYERRALPIRKTFPPVPPPPPMPKRPPPPSPPARHEAEHPVDVICETGESAYETRSNSPAYRFAVQAEERRIRDERASLLAQGKTRTYAHSPRVEAELRVMARGANI